MPAFYPSLVVNLKLKFDERLTVLRRPSAPADLDAVAAAPEQAGRPATEPLVLRASVADSSFVLGRIPTRCAVELPGYRQAATFDLEMPYRDLPIDPRAVRAAAVEVYLGTVEAGSFGSGVTEDASTARLFGRTSVLRTREASGEPLRDNLLMVGLVDEWEVTHGKQGSTVHMRGRDLRGALLDTPIATSPEETEKFFVNIDVDEDIVTIVRKILALNPLFADVVVRFDPSEWPDGAIASPRTNAAVVRHRKGAKGGKKPRRSAGPSRSHEMNFWDLIVRECYLVGAIPYFVGAELWVRPARGIFDQARAGLDPSAPTPFSGGKPRATDARTRQPMAAPLRYRQLVYGRDVEELSFQRKFAGYHRPHIVRVVTVDDDSADRGGDRLLTAQWPRASDLAKMGPTRVAPGGDVSQQEYLNIPVSGVRDPQQLERIAQAVYEEIGRGELGGSCRTPNVTSFGGDNGDPDMLRLRPGDGVEFAVDVRNLGPTAPLVSTYTDANRDPYGRAVEEVLRVLGRDNENLARVIVATTQNRIAELQRFFRVATVRYDWTAERGVAVAFDFQNYVVARNQVDDLPPSPPTRGQQAAAFVARRSP